MNLANVMDALSVRLDTITGLRCWPYPPGSVTPPASVIGYPTVYTYDEAYARGVDRMILPVVIVIGRPYDRTTRDQLAAYLAGSGTSSVKAVLESGTYTACDIVRVMSAEVDTYTIAGTDYLAAIFDVEIVGKGT